MVALKKIIGKRFHSLLYDKVFKIPTPTGKGDFPGDPLPNRNFPVKEIEMHDRRTFDYNGMAVRPPRIAGAITNSHAHMVNPSNRGRQFDAVWVHLKTTVKYALQSAVAFMAGLFILSLGLHLWPIVMFIWMYSGYKLGEYFVTRHRYFTSRSRQTITQNLQIPSERWSNYESPLKGG
jgi:hypothetical protein